MCGLCSESARRKLLTESNLTLAKAVEFAQCMELADKDAKEFKGIDASIQKLYVPPRKQGGTTPHPSKPCYRCSRTNHQAKDCRFADATCHYCKKKGHIAPACLKKKREAALPNITKHIAPDDSDADKFKLYNVGSKAL